PARFDVGVLQRRVDQPQGRDAARIARLHRGLQRTVDVVAQHRPTLQTARYSEASPPCPIPFDAAECGGYLSRSWITNKTIPAGPKRRQPPSWCSPTARCSKAMAWARPAM